jgi:hypothetical protein
MRDRTIVLGLSVLVLTACADHTTPEPARLISGEGEASRPKDVLLVGSEDGPLAVEMATGSVIFQRRGAVPGPDGSLVYVGSSDGDHTVLETLDATTGAALSSTGILGRLEVRVAAGSGRAVALMEPLPEGTDPWTPIPRSQTAIVVADPTGAREVRRYTLSGNFEPEAFSADDSELFLIQHLPAEAPTAYRVTVLDLATGAVRPVRGRFDAPPELMPGIRLAQAYAPEGGQLYTLYSSRRPGYAHAAAVLGSAEPVSFIHVLDLVEGWAYCVGLPRPFWGRPAAAQAIAPSPDGERLYIADAGIGLVSVMNTASLRITGTEELAVPAGRDARTSAQVSLDGGTLFVAAAGVGTEILAMETAAFEVRRRWKSDGTVFGLGLSADARWLYLALVDRLAALDASTGQEFATVPFRGAQSILRVQAPSS